MSLRLPRARLFVVLLLAVATVAVFHPALTAEFVEWDDEINFVRNTSFRGLSLTHLQWMSQATVMGHYIPLTWLTLGIDYSLWGMDPRGYHLTNLVLHAAGVVTFLALALRLLKLATSLGEGPRLLAAAVAALFFAIHPLRAESVAWITERRDVLSGLLFLLTILGYVAAQEATGTRRRLLLFASVAAYGAAALSKSIVMGLPLILLVLDIYPLRRLELGRGMLRRSRHVLIEKLPYLVIGVACGATAYYVVKTVTEPMSFENFTWSGRAAMVFYTLWFQVTRTLMPLALSPLYELPHGLSILEPRFGLIALGVTAITAGIFALRKRWPAGLAAWACYAIVLAPVAGVVQPGLQLAHDRYSYLSCLGWALILGAAAGALADRRLPAVGPWFRGMALGAVAIWILALGWLATEQTRVWRDTYSLWSHAVDSEPSCAACHSNLAAHLLNKGDAHGAMHHAKIAIALRPDRVRAYAVFGQALIEMNRPAEAIPYIEVYVRATPDSSDIAALGLALIRAGRPEDALAPLERSLALKPDSITNRVNYAAAFVKLGRRDAAMAEYGRAIEQDPHSPVARYGLGWALVQFGDADGARRQHIVLAVLDARLAADLGRHIAAIQ